MTDPLPLQLLQQYTREFPDAWKLMASMYRERGEGVLPSWPDWCYCPVVASATIINTEKRTRTVTPQEELEYFFRHPPATLSALGAWRITKGIYRFDPALYEEIIDMPLEEKLPVDIFLQLPEWCIYVETPGRGENDMSGFFAFLEYDIPKERAELRLILVSKNLETFPVALHLGNWDIEESLSRSIREEMKERERLERKFHLPPEIPTDSESIRESSKTLAPIMNLILYICSVNADMPERPAHPAKRRPTKKGRIPAAEKVHTWDVGIRVGASLGARKYSTEETEGNTDSSVSRNSPRPHVRRAHWHHYWMGPRSKPEKRKLVLKWLPPTPIGMPKNEDPGNIQPVVIYPVNKEE